jgi:opacity protein-like surface antigen
MKKFLLLTACFAVTMISAASAQSISNVNTYEDPASVYNDPAIVYYANDSIYFELTVHFPAFSEMSQMTNDELFESVFLMDYTHGDWANDYIVANVDDSWTVGTIPYGTTRTYRGSYYVGNITSSTDMEVEWGTGFSKTDGFHEGNGIVDFTYNP